MPALISIIGHKYGRLTVLSREGRRGHSTTWLCRCDCGSERVVASSNLRSGNTLSCGCLRLEKTVAARKTHGLSGTLTYRNWSAMIARCLCKTDKNYPDYGGSGIKVCARWQGRGGFDRFYEDMGPRPSKSHSLDRINRNGNYEPGNVRWATPTEQSRNRSWNRMVEYRGRLVCVAELSEITGVPQQTIAGRLDRGLTVNEAVS